MKEDLNKHFYEKYPKMFARHRGLECDDGWFDLIDMLCSSIQFHLDHNNRDGKIPQVEIRQIKEKFGSLRFYISGGNEFLDGKISFAELMSGHICEISGLPGKLCQKGGWYKTLSEEKAKELGFDLVEEKQ
jgi:hypothetical protein